jgi:hypothetical protein
MSKVYSFRLDENNPREAQAKEIIDAWVAQGYFLRHQLVDVLISFQNKEFESNQFTELFEKIECLIVASKQDEGDDSVETSVGILTESFIGSISKSVKSGISIE